MALVTNTNTAPIDKPPGVLEEAGEEATCRGSNERLFLKQVSWSTALGFGFAFAAVESLGMNPANLSLHISGATLVAFLIGAVLGFACWTILTRDSGPRPSSLQRRATIILLLGGLGEFLYPLRFLSRDSLAETLEGLAIAVLALSVVGFTLWRIKGFLEHDAAQSEIESKKPAMGQSALKTLKLRQISSRGTPT